MSRSITLPSILCPQATRSETFTPPPFDVYLSVPEVYDWHFNHSALHPYGIYFDDVKNTTVNILWKDALRVVYHIATIVSRGISATKNDNPKPTVALYSSSDNLTYILSMIGIMRAGCPVFLISGRTSPTVLQHLLVQSGVTHILMNEDPALISKLNEVKENVDLNISISNIPSSDILFGEDYDVEIPPPVRPALDDLCLILHSSGSTSLPELNLWTHEMMHGGLWQAWYGEKDVCGEILSTSSIPMAGAAGVFQGLITASSGMILSGFKPVVPAIQPTPQNVWKSMVETKSTYSFAFQPFLASWAEDDSKITILAELKGVMFGGGPLPKLVGDKLAREGVHVFPLFGSSECGLMNRVFPKKIGENWEYFSFFPLVSPAFRQDGNDGTVELVLKKCSTHTPTKTNIVFDGVPAFATSDLLQPHPTIPGLWKYLCRISDQETLGLGPTKFNAVALARVLMSDPRISGAVLVTLNISSGIAFRAIVEPTTHGSTDTESFKSLVWSTFERYNNIAPDPAKLNKDQVIIASKDKPFTYGEKGMPRKKEVIESYQTELQSSL